MVNWGEVVDGQLGHGLRARQGGGKDCTEIEGEMNDTREQIRYLPGKRRQIHRCCALSGAGIVSADEGLGMVDHVMVWTMEELSATWNCGLIEE